jgi:hypothetical protein
VSEKFVTPSEIDPATFRLVTQCLNQLRHKPEQEIVVEECGSLEQAN